MESKKSQNHLGITHAGIDILHTSRRQKLLVTAEFLDKFVEIAPIV